MIFELAYKLNEELLKNELIINVKEKEEIMNNDKDFIKLIMNYESLKAEVNDLERYNLDSSIKREELFLLKYQIDTLKVVKEYKEAYNTAKRFLEKIAKEAFKDIDEDLKLNSIL